MDTKAISEIQLQAMHQREMLERVEKFQRESKACTGRRRPVYGVYNQNGYLIWWSTGRAAAQHYAEKMDFGDGRQVTMKLISA